jgi:hypothetical protein
MKKQAVKVQNRGGFRPGSGRKKSPYKIRAVTVTIPDTELCKMAVQQLAYKLRNEALKGT